MQNIKNIKFIIDIINKTKCFKSEKHAVPNVELIPFLQLIGIRHMQRIGPIKYFNMVITKQFINTIINLKNILFFLDSLK